MKVIGNHKILLPKGVDLQKWAVVACDQFTSQPSYWERLSEYVGEAPSALNLIFPEVYLNGDIEARIADINSNMQTYLDEGLFEELDGFVLTERTLEDGGKRVGLVLSVDLENYDYHRVRIGIRATEDTIVERLPVRMKIRENAPIELPHILLLVDDDEKRIIEPLYESRNSLRKLYDFDLNMDGGHIVGYQVTDVEPIIAKFEALLDSDTQIRKYGSDEGIMLAVGDGNHSMATAKEHWNKIKQSLSPEEIENHPARYALVEVINVYDDDLRFLPIHRVVYADGDFLDNLERAIGGEGKLTVITKDGDKTIACPLLSSDTIHAVQSYIENNLGKGIKNVDYIHGEEHLREVVAKGGVGLLMPEFKKDELLKYVVTTGNLPKKAFSIGSAENKKYYIEAKRIK